jgi:hypothetical protein
MLRKSFILVCVSSLACSPLLADFTYQETSTVTGGMVASMLKVAGVFSKQAREPIVSTVSVKGNRMLHRSQYRASVIDLDAQTITSIDFQKKTYSVMTFDEMKQALDQMQQRMKQQSADNQAQVNFKVEVKPTGQTKPVSGLDCKEMILTMTMEGTDEKTGQKGGMVITSDMWISPDAAGYKEVREFHRRMAEKMAWTPGGNMFMQNPQASQGMAELYKEAAKLEGIPAQQSISMGVAGQPGSGQAQPQQQPPAQRPSLGGMLGSRIGISRQNKDSQQPQATPADNSGAGGAPGSLLQMTTELSSFSPAPVDDSQFLVPAGFKKVEPDLKRVR